MDKFNCFIYDGIFEISIKMVLRIYNSLWDKPFGEFNQRLPVKVNGSNIFILKKVKYIKQFYS